MTASSPSPYAVARDLIDSAHRRDPAYISSLSSTSPSTPSTTTTPHELAYADSVEAWSLKLIEDPFYASLHPSVSNPASPSLELLKLGARCQHLERFLTPRSSYPEGKAGYFKWRRELYIIQADRAKELLLQAGVNEAEAECVRKWVSKTDLQPGKESGELGTKLLEDAAVLVFLEEQLSAFATEHSQTYPREKFVDIIKKTWRKLSPAGKRGAGTLTMDDPSLSAIVAEATGGMAGEAEAGAEAEIETENEKETDDTKLVGETSVALEAGSNVPPAVASKEQVKSTSTSTKAKAKATSSVLPVNAGESSIRSSNAPSHVKKGDQRQDADVDAEGAEEEEAAEGQNKFGARLLGEQDDEWTHNAWDHVQPPSDYLETIQSALSRQALDKVPTEDAEAYHANAASHWDAFYAKHENRFFKDRKWLHLEFGDLVEGTREGAPPMTVLEVGCGAGNTVFPLLSSNKNPGLHIVACDYAREAVEVVKSNELYRNPPCGTCFASVWDLSAEKIDEEGEGGAPQTVLPEGVEKESVDIVVLIFVLSALRPEEWSAAVRNIRTILKPGGLVLLRDYGRHDLPQLRFRKKRMLQDNFYVRGDGTRVYFFEPVELERMFCGRGAGTGEGEEDGDAQGEGEGQTGQGGEEGTELQNGAGNSSPTTPTTTTVTNAADDGQPFEKLQLAVDRRLLLNRKERKKMYRVWLQAKFRKVA